MRADLWHLLRQWLQSLPLLTALQDVLELYAASGYEAKLTNVRRFKVLLKTLLI